MVGTDLLDLIRRRPADATHLLGMTKETRAVAGNEGPVGIGHRREQKLCVGMPRIADDGFRAAPFHHLAGEHDDHLLRDMRRGGNVVGNVEQRKPPLAFDAG
jgi:hypothetical protein